MGTVKKNNNYFVNKDGILCERAIYTIDGVIELIKNTLNINRIKLRYYQDVYDRYSQPDTKYIDLYVGYYTAERNREKRDKILKECVLKIKTLNLNL